MAQLVRNSATTSAVHVYHDDVVAALRPDPVGAKSIEVFAKAVGIGQPSNLKQMIDDGLVQTTSLKNPVTKADQRYFTEENEAAFRDRFATPRLLAQIHGAPWQKLVRQLRDAGVEPIGGKNRPYGNVYLRSETDRILT